MTNNHLRINRILDILENNHPHAKIALNYSNNWELLVSVILSAQCTDVKVNEVTAKLFKKYPSITDYAKADIGELEQDIKSTGFYHNKAKNIQNSARMILEKFNGKIPDTMDNILKLPGVARKTGNVVLGNAYGVVAGIAVDTHVIRLSQRLRLVNLKKVGPNKKPVYYSKVTPVETSSLPWSTPAPLRVRGRLSTRRDVGSTGFGRTSRFLHDKNLGPSEDYYKDAKPEKIEKELMKNIPHKNWFKFTYQIIDHGRAICKAQNPKCKICPLHNLCPSSRI